MAKHTRTLTVSPHEAREYERLLREPDSGVEKDRAIYDEEVKFPGGIRFAIQVVSTTCPATEPCWTQGVLFTHDGIELGCTEVGESLLGEYTIDHGDDIYEVVVVVEGDDENKIGPDTLSIDDVTHEIGEVLATMPGEEVARIYNEICASQIRYVEDSIWERDDDTPPTD